MSSILRKKLPLFPFFHSHFTPLQFYFVPNTILQEYQQTPGARIQRVFIVFLNFSVSFSFFTWLPVSFLLTSVISASPTPWLAPYFLDNFEILCWERLSVSAFISYSSYSVTVCVLLSDSHPISHQDLHLFFALTPITKAILTQSSVGICRELVPAPNPHPLQISKSKDAQVCYVKNVTVMACILLVIV